MFHTLSMEFVWVMSRIWMSHVTHMSEWYALYTHSIEFVWVMSHIWMSHVTDMSEWYALHTHSLEFVWVMSHIWCESCHTYDVSHVTHMFHTDGIEFLASAPDQSYDLNIVDVNASDDDKVGHVPFMNESCHSFTNESCHTYQRVVSPQHHSCRSLRRR